MKFTPQAYKNPDRSMENFIDKEEIWDFINKSTPTTKAVQEVIAKSLNKERLNLEDVAILVKATEPEQIEMIKNGATTLKKQVYGNRICRCSSLLRNNGYFLSDDGIYKGTFSIIPSTENTYMWF